MNYIFLDIDGVMNNKQDWLAKKNKSTGKFDNACMFCDQAWQMLSDVCKATDARIILSSSWRLGLKEDGDRIYALFTNEEKLLNYFDKYEIRLVALTDNKGSTRGKQIIRFVKDYLTPYDDYVVLDDEDFDIANYIPKEQFIKTEFETGLQPEHCKRIIDYFNK